MTPCWYLSPVTMLCCRANAEHHGHRCGGDCPLRATRDQVILGCREYPPDLYRRPQEAASPAGAGPASPASEKE